MHKPLNKVQLAVLQWIADDRPAGIYDEGFEHRITARALERRGLVKVRGHGESWTAAITEGGQFYLEHGRYKSDEMTVTASRPKKVRQSRMPKPAGAKSPEGRTSDAPVGVDPANPESTPPKTPRLVIDETIPMPAEIGRAHPAIRELVKYKKRLDVPDEARQRALLILHALVQESRRRGWEVTPQLSTVRPATLYTRQERVWPGGDLFVIDAGRCSAADENPSHRSQSDGEGDRGTEEMELESPTEVLLRRHGQDPA